MAVLPDAVVDTVSGREHHDRNLSLTGTCGPQDLQAVHVWQAKVEHSQRDTIGL
jgi:hypothetical protein